MHPTVLGLAVLPLTLLWAGKPHRLLELALVAAIFDAGAALIVGNFGLPLAMVPGLAFVTFVVLQYALGMRYPGERSALWTLTPLIALLCYAIFSIVMLPETFAGQIMVAPQKMDAFGSEYAPLAFTSGNITQTLYLAMNVTTAICTAVFLTRARISYRRLVSAYLLSGYCAVGFAFWQFANRVAHVPFPDALLYCNPSWAIVDQKIGSVPRIQGTFSEPAGLAFYLAGLCFCCLWLTARGYRLMRVNVLLALSILAMLLSTSTTGIAVLAVGLPLIVIVTILRGDGGSLLRLGKTSAILLLAGSFAISPALILQPKLVDQIGEVFDATKTKGDSDSYDDRSKLDQAGLATLAPTYGLGVGWGSFRTSSFVPGLVANGGIFGIVAVFWLGRRLMRSIRRAHRAVPNHPGRVLIEGFSAALCGQLSAALLSSPTIASLPFFLELGCIAGTAGRILVEARGPIRRPRLATLAIAGRIS